MMQTGAAILSRFGKSPIADERKRVVAHQQGVPTARTVGEAPGTDPRRGCFRLGSVPTRVAAGCAVRLQLTAPRLRGIKYDTWAGRQWILVL